MLVSASSNLLVEFILKSVTILRKISNKITFTLYLCIALKANRTLTRDKCPKDPHSCGKKFRFAISILVFNSFIIKSISVPEENLGKTVLKIYGFLKFMPMGWTILFVLLST